jgi:LPXTG-motif cell wall-anchored protein
MLSAEKGYKEIVKLLIQKGANVNVSNDYGETPLIFAAREGHKEVVAELIAGKADVNAKTNDKDYEMVIAYQTPLMAATINGHVEIAKMLIDAKANLNSKDKFGNSILSYTVTHHRPKIFKLLKDAGAEGADTMEPPTEPQNLPEYNMSDDGAGSNTWIIILVIVLLAGAGAGGFFFYKKKKAGGASAA